jgi:thioredoxin
MAAATPKVKEIKSAKEWSQTLIAAKKPVVLDLYGTWCRPCAMLAPKLEELAAKYAGRIEFYKVDTDKVPDLAAAFKISALPTVHIYGADKRLKKEIVGLSERELKHCIEELFE